VHDLLVVREGERLAHLDQHVEHTARRDRAAPAHDLFQCVAVDELHRDVVTAVLLARVVDGHDVRMIELRGALGLAKEVLERLRILLQCVGQHLVRDEPVENGVLRLVDDAHSAAPEFPDDLVATRLRSQSGNGISRDGHGFVARPLRRLRARRSESLLDVLVVVVAGEDLFVDLDRLAQLAVRFVTVASV